MTRRIHAVSKKNHCLTTFDSFELFRQDVCKGIVQPRAATSTRSANRFRDHVAIGRRLAHHLDAVVKRHYHHAVVGFQLIDKLDGSVLNVFETKLC